MLKEKFRGGKKVLLFEVFMERNRREERKGRRVKRREEMIHV